MHNPSPTPLSYISLIYIYENLKTIKRSPVKYSLKTTNTYNLTLPSFTLTLPYPL